MDTRTTLVLKALDGTAIELLAALIEAPATEKALLAALPEVTQSNAHKKLDRLADSGIIYRESGETTRGHPWMVVAPEVTADALDAILALADALDVADRQRRDRVRKQIAKVGRSTLRVVEGQARKGRT
jgi:predicted transcriptional regulator